MKTEVLDVAGLHYTGTIWIALLKLMLGDGTNILGCCNAITISTKKFILFFDLPIPGLGGSPPKSYSL